MRDEIKKIINKRNVIILTIAIILICFVLPMIITVIAYEANFGSRVTIDENNSMMKFEDYEMSRENIEFKSNKGQTLRGYLYTKEGVEPKALIFLSHGYLNVHEDYLAQINYFVENGFEVMGYDNTGTNLSDGDNLIGLGQSAIDLDYALRFVESNEDLNKYKVFLYGHSWGGYAVTYVLNYGHNVAGVVARSGYNNSRDMLVEYGSNLYGDWLKLLSPYAYIYIYEKIKFGDAIDKNGVKGINASKDTPVMLFHSKDDDVISLDNSLLIHKDEFVNPDRIKTVLLEDR